MTGSRVGLILAHSAIGTPYVVIVQNFDMTLVKTARGLGASYVVVVRRIIVPIIQPAVFAGAIFAFVASFDEVIIAIFLAGPEQVTLPIRLFEGLRDELTPVVISAAVVMICVSVGAMVVAEALRRRSDRQRGIE